MYMGLQKVFRERCCQLACEVCIWQRSGREHKKRLIEWKATSVAREKWRVKMWSLKSESLAVVVATRILFRTRQQHFYRISLHLAPSNLPLLDICAGIATPFKQCWPDLNGEHFPHTTHYSPTISLSRSRDFCPAPPFHSTSDFAYGQPLGSDTTIIVHGVSDFSDSTRHGH